MISLDKLPENTRSLFIALELSAENGDLEDMLLIGGTALAMRLGHRLSEDIDFAVGELRLPVKKIASIIKNLEANGCEVIDILSPADRENFENDGLDIENYQQDWLVNGTKLAFFTFGDNKYDQSVIKDSSFDIFHGIKIASLDTISKAKCFALTKRTKSRDLFDVYKLIQEGHLSVESIVSEMQKFNHRMTYETCVHRIIEKPIQHDDEGLHSVGVNMPVDQIRQFLSAMVSELEGRVSQSLIAQFKDSHQPKARPLKP